MFLNYASRNVFFGLIETILSFVLASLFFQEQSLLVYDVNLMGVFLSFGFGFTVLGLLLAIFVFVGYFGNKMEKTNSFAMLFGFSGVIILFLSGIQLMGAVPLILERSILNVAMIIAAVGLIINQW